MKPINFSFQAKKIIYINKDSENVVKPDIKINPNKINDASNPTINLYSTEDIKNNAINVNDFGSIGSLYES